MSVKFYNDNAEEFFNNTVNADMSATYNIFEDNLLEKNGEILDLGCGSERDSKHFLDSGFSVTALDLSPILAKKASQFIGQDVIVSDMKALDFQDRFIGIWACASLLHLSEDEVFETIKRCHKALKIEEIFEENPSVKRDEILRYTKSMDAFTDAEEFLIDFFKSTRTSESDAVAARLEDSPEEVERLLNGLLTSKKIRVKKNQNEFIVWYL